MWISYAVIWLVGTIGVFWVWQLDLFRPILFSSPAWVTLAAGPNMRPPTPRRVAAYTLVLFLTYWSVIQSYPVQCRNAWGAAMVGDSTYWKNNTAISQALMAEKNHYFPMLPVDAKRWRDRLTTPRRPLFISHRQHGSQRGVSSKSAENILYMVQKQNPDSNIGEKWVMPWTRGDTLENFELRAYCDLHKNDSRLPHVYPLRTFGINSHEVSMSASCPFWTCVLTEARPGGKLGFLWLLAVPALLHAAHYRLTCRICVYTLGTGQCRLWWVWFWASLLPFWLVMLIKSTRDQELIPFFVEELTVLFEIRKWFIGQDTQRDNEHLAVFVVILGLGVLSYIFRERIRQELGLDELVPLLFSAGRTGGRHTFQLCIWRVDVHAQAGPMTFADEATVIDQGAAPIAADDAGEQSVLPSIGLFGGSPFKGLWSYLPMVSRSRRVDGFTLHGRDGQPPRAISVRFCYGQEEVQRTRSEHISHGYDGAFYDFCENFTVSVEPRPNVEFRVEVRDESTGGDALGSINFSESRLKRQFMRSKTLVKQMDMSVADEQVLQMRQVKSMARASEELRMRRMGEAGFIVHRLPDGGAVWLAFSELSDEGPGLLSCCGP